MASGVLFSKVEQAAARFPDFVSELQGFFAQYGLPVGTPEALPALADRVSTEDTFRDDLVSMVNVLCAEEEQISYLELLGLLLVAALGMERASSLGLDLEAEEPVRRIFNFVVESRRPKQETADVTDRADGVQGEVVEPRDFTAVDLSTQRTPDPGPEITPVVMHDPVRAEPRGSVLARALAISADEESFGPKSVPAPAQPAPEAEAPFRIFAQHAAVKEPATRRVPVWAVGLGGVVLGLALGLLWPRHEAQSTPQPSSATPTSVTPAVGEKGSPRRDGAARVLPNETAAQVTGITGRASERARDPEVPYASSAGMRRSGDRTVPGPPVASLDRGAAGSSSSMPSASNTGRLLPGAVVPSVHAVNLTAPADAAPRNARTRLPSVVMGSSGIMAANLISGPTPPYPDQASAAGVQGEVVVEVVVGRDGSVIETRVVSGPELLRQASVNAVQRWQFRPYKVDGAPSEIVTTARLQFRLNGE